MYCCLECGHVFSEDDVAVWKEDRGEWWGSPCYETLSGCPQCGGGYAETYRCACCHEWILGTYVKLNDGDRICDECYTPMELGDED